MPTQCYVPGCRVRGNGHMFPRDEARKKQWLIAIRKKNYKPSIHAKVCKKHFTPEDYTLPKDSVIENPLPILKKDAVPSVFSWSDTEGDTGETNPNPKRRRRKIRQAPVRPIRQAPVRPIRQAPVRPMAVNVSNNPVHKLPRLAQPIKAKLMRVPNDPSLIARLEAARKALVAKPKVPTADLGMKAMSESMQFKPISSSYKCFAYDSRLTKPPVTESQLSPNLDIGPRAGYRIKSNKSNASIPSNKLIQARLSPYTLPIKIQEIKVEKDTETEENELTHSILNIPCMDPLFTGCNLSQKAIQIKKEADMQVDEDTDCTADPAAWGDPATPHVDRTMRVDIKKEKAFVALECVEVEFESKFKDKGVQCNIGDPCCSISLRKEPQFGREKYNNSCLKNFKKRRISV